MPRKPLSDDTPLEIEEIWLAGLRARGAVWSLARMAELSLLSRQAAEVAIRRANPDATPVERDELLLTHLYGEPELARRVVELRRARKLYE